MEAIILIVSIIGWVVSDIDSMDLYFYIDLALYKGIRHYTKDKTARR